MPTMHLEIITAERVVYSDDVDVLVAPGTEGELGVLGSLETGEAGEEDGSGRSADPMDGPRAIAQIIAMPGGTRPLRTEVHPGSKPQMRINEVTAQVQVGWLGESGYGPLIKAVHNVD